MAKAYIFDQDGTLYSRSSELYKTISRLTRQWIMRSLSLTDLEVEALYARLQVTHPNPLDGFTSLGLSVNDYHKCVFDLINPSLFLQKDQRLIETLLRLKGYKYLVTFSSPQFSNQVLRKLGVIDIFRNVFFVDDLDGTHDKLTGYEKIRNKLALLPQDICIVGDSFFIDIASAQNIGYSCVAISSCDIEGVITIPTIYELQNLEKERKI